MSDSAIDYGIFQGQEFRGPQAIPGTAYPIPDYGDSALNSEDATKAVAVPLSLPKPADHDRHMEALLRVRKIGDSLEVGTSTDGILLRALLRT